LDHQDGISPQPHSQTYLPSGPGRVGAVEGQDDEEDFEDLVASGAFEDDAKGMQEEISGSREVGGLREDDDEEGQDPSERKAPMKHSPEEVARHNLTHIPRRMWCKVCAEADMQEDPHRKSKVDHKDDGIPEVHMDYKELHKGERPFPILRERATGSTFGMRCSQK
jgi:hypothetical protein